MEITLEKIELVKDRTGVSYREAKEALEATEGNVVDAIIAIEDTINQRVGAKLTDSGAKVIEKIKEAVKKGNVARITVRKDGETVLNIPINALIIGTALAWWLTAIGTLISLGAKCDILLIKDDGTVVDISGKVEEAVGTVRDKGGEALDAVRAKASDAAGKVRNVKDSVGAGAEEFKETVAGKAADAATKAEEFKEAVAGKAADAKSKASEVSHIVKDAAQEIKETVAKDSKAVAADAAEAGTDTQADAAQSSETE